MSCFNQHFSDLSLHNVSELLRVETVGGDALGCHGYFECTITIPVTDTYVLSERIPILVVPDTTYNSTVPLLVGTNVLRKLLDLPVKPIFSQLQVAVRVLQMQTRHLDRAQGVYSNVVSVTDISIPPYSGRIAEGRAAISIPVCQQIALVQNYSDSISIVPSVVNINQGQNSVPIEIYNDSDSTLRISKGEKIANLHQATIQIPEDTGKPDFLDSFDYSHLSEEDTIELKSFLTKHRDVFAMNMQEMGSTDVVEHRIDLEDETPFREKPRPVPPGMYDELRAYLAELLSAGVIQESKSPWSSNIVLVRKKDNTLPLCFDYQRLNLRSILDEHNIPRIETLIDSHKGAQ